MKFKFKLLGAAALTAGTLSLCGCGNLPFVQSAPNFNTTYTVNADITFDKVKAKADVTRVTENEWEFKFTEPKSLNGLTVKLNDEKLSVSLGGLSLTADKNSVYTNAPRIISDALGSLAKTGNENITATEGVLTYTDKLNDKKFVITANEKTGALLSLKSPSHKLSVDFSNQAPFSLDLPESANVKEN